MIAALGLVLALATAETKSGLAVRATADSGRSVATKAKAVGPDTSSRKAVSTRAKTEGVDTSKAPATATKAVVESASAPDTGAVTATRAARDTSETHHLPPRTLPLKRQMMFAGGFMVFIALMMTSLQNFNPND